MEPSAKRIKLETKTATIDDLPPEILDEILFLSFSSLRSLTGLEMVSKVFRKLALGFWGKCWDNMSMKFHQDSFWALGEKIGDCEAMTDFLRAKLPHLTGLKNLHIKDEERDFEHCDWEEEWTKIVRELDRGLNAPLESLVVLVPFHSPIGELFSGIVERNTETLAVISFPKEMDLDSADFWRALTRCSELSVAHFTSSAQEIREQDAIVSAFEDKPALSILSIDFCISGADLASLVRKTKSEGISQFSLGLNVDVTAFLDIYRHGPTRNPFENTLSFTFIPDGTPMAHIFEVFPNLLVVNFAQTRTYNKPLEAVEAFLNAYADKPKQKLLMICCPMPTGIERQGGWIKVLTQLVAGLQQNVHYDDCCVNSKERNENRIRKLAFYVEESLGFDWNISFFVNRSNAAVCFYTHIKDIPLNAVSFAL